MNLRRSIGFGVRAEEEGMSARRDRLALAIRAVITSWRSSTNSTPEATERARERAKALLEPIGRDVRAEDDTELHRILDGARREVERGQSTRRGGRG
jgi:hypothetical protein